MQFIDLKAQYQALKHEINANIQSVLDSAEFIGGSYVKELETYQNLHLAGALTMVTI